MAGTLYVVATPIGNLEDLSFRALRTLREVDLVAAEDTRRTAKLLTHYEVHKPLVSLHERNEYREAPRLVARLVRGENIALVSDAGTPAIADPGARLVRLARQAGLPVVPIPGPSAITAALSVAGLEAPEFVFMGFPPPKGSERTRWLRRVSREPLAVVAFEAPHRIRRTLYDLATILVDRPILTAREITKIHFDLVEWNSNGQATDLHERGEFVLVISPRPGSDVSASKAIDAANLFGYITESSFGTEADALDAVSVALRIHPDRVEGAVRTGLKLVKRQRMTKA